MNYKYMMFAMLLAIGTTTDTMAQKKTAKTSKTSIAANADSVEIRKLLDAAKKGNAESQNTLGTYYYSGKKVAQNYDVALRWFSMAAKQKHVKAIANMGLCYQLGHGIKQDSTIAIKLYKESVKAGNTELVKQREENIDKRQSLFDIMLLADIYYNGCGNTVKKDINKALKYYEMAANSSLDATMKAANIYDNAKMYAEALPYYKKAADNGNSLAAYKYGEYLCTGKGTVVDKTKAAAYLDRAAKNNVVNAMMMLGDLLYKGDGIQQDYSRAMNLYKRAAAQNNPAAAWNVGIMYKKGLGVKENYIIALQWLAKASATGMKANFQKQMNDANVEINNGWKGTDFYSFLQAMAYIESLTPDYAAATKVLASLEKKRQNGGVYAYRTLSC